MSKLYTYFLTLCLVICCISITQAQVEPEPYSAWYFGQKAGVTFSKKDEASPIALNKVRIDGQLQSAEGCASIADNSGNLLFYTNGMQVWTRNHKQMTNGTGLRGDTSATQAVMIIPQPKNPDLYYIFTIDQGTSGNDMFYSIVDMSRQKGYGEVITRNVLMANNMSERITTTLKYNGDDYWVMTHEANSDRFLAFSFDATGVNTTPVVSAVGSKHVGTCGSIGYMKTRCNKLAVAITNCTIATDQDRVEVFDFDNFSGKVTRFIRTYKIPNAYGIEFSTTARYLYVSGWHGGNLFRIDLKEPPSSQAAKILLASSNAYGSFSEVNSFGALMMGPDRKIYVAKNKTGFLGVINENGYYTDNKISLEGKKSGFGLPNIPQFICECDFEVNYINIPTPVKSPYCINSDIVFEGKIYSPPFDPLIKDPVRWHFGDTATDSLGNTSVSNATSHAYPFPGTYKVKLYRKCYGKELLVATKTVVIADCGKITAKGLCINEIAQFSIPAANKVQSIVWDFGDPASGVNNTSTLLHPSHKYSRIGTFHVTAQVVYIGGYTNTYSTSVTIYPPPNVDLGPDINTCNGDKVPPFFQVCEFGDDASYFWHDGSSECFYITKPTDEFVAVKVSIGSCVGIDTVWINRDRLDLGFDREICPGDTAVLVPNGRWDTYLWQNGSTDSFFVANATGIYTLTASRAGCTTSASVKVTVVTPPDSGLPKDTVICPPQDFVFLDVTKADTSIKYLWSTGDTTAFKVISHSGTYWVELSKGDCKVRDSIEVALVRTIGLPDTLISCAADSLTTLDAYVGVADATYQWSTGSTNSSITVKQKGWYKVTATYKNCVQTDSTFLDFSKAPVVDIGRDTVLCASDTLVVNAFVPGTNYSYFWNTGSTDPFINITKTGEYTVTVTNDTCTTVKSIRVTVPELELGNDRTVCADEIVYVRPQVLLPGATYTWNTLQTGDSIQVLPPGGQIIATMTYQGCTLTDTVTITMVSKPSVDLGKDTTLCDPANPLVLNAGAGTSGVSYLWSDGTTDSTLTTNASGTYWVEVSQGDCAVYDTITVNYLEIKFPKDTTICEGDAIVLDASQSLPATYSWHDGSTIPIFYADTAGTYWVDITISGCSRRDTVEVKLIPKPLLNLGQDTVICGTQPLVLNSGNPNTVWSTGVTGASITVDATATYIASIRSGGCIVTDSIKVTYLNDTAFNLGADQKVCDKTHYLLDASKGLDPGIDPAIVSYLWAGTNSISYFKLVTTEGWHKVKVSFNTTCAFEITDSVYVSFGTTPQIDLGQDKFLCKGDTLTLNATSTLSGVTYLWQNNSQSPTYEVTQSGTYWVQVTNNGCVATDTVKVVYADDFSLGGDRIMCDKQPVFLNAYTQGITSYQWQDGSTKPYYWVTQTGTYWVEVSNGTCTARDSVYIEYVPTPVANLGADTVVCNVEEYVINIQNPEPGVNYQWSDASTGDSLLVKKTGWYWVDATRNTCKSRDSVFVFLPSLYLNLGGDTTICVGTELMLGNLPMDGLTYEWSTGATSSMITVTQPGDYFVEVKIAGSDCIFRDRVTVTVRECDAETDNLFIPNIITPNNDLKNDKFVIEGISNKGWALEIYNRWGSLIYKTDNYRNNWEGAGFPSGLYYYHLKHPTKTDKRYKGWLKILR